MTEGRHSTENLFLFGAKDQIEKSICAFECHGIFLACMINEYLFKVKRLVEPCFVPWKNMDGRQLDLAAILFLTFSC